MHFFLIILLGLAVGILVGLMGIGGGIVVVPSLVYLVGMEQHLAQGTSLFLLLPPLGAGALYRYWKQRQVDLPAGAVCAAGFLVGGYLGGFLAIQAGSRFLRGLFGCFLIFAAAMLWQQARTRARARKPDA